MRTLLAAILITAARSIRLFSTLCRPAGSKLKRIVISQEDIDQGYPTAVLYNTDQPCQYEHDFESLYTQSVLLLQRSLTEADDLANKNTVGEWLHFTISNYISFNRAGKITGMFLAAFTVPEIIAQIHEFSSLSHLCNQALEAILESQSQESKSNVVDCNEQKYYIVELTIPRYLSLESHYSFTTMITVDRPDILAIANILQSNYFSKFNLIAPCWAKSLDSQYCTVSSLSVSDEQRFTLLTHVHVLRAVHNDCIHCQSFPQLEDVLRYIWHMGCHTILLRPSRAFVKSVYSQNISDDALFKEQKVFSVIIIHDKIMFLEKYCEFRLLVDTEDLHPTFERFRSIAQHNLKRVFLCICKKIYTDLLRVSPRIDRISLSHNSSSDSESSDFSDSENEASSGNDLSEQDTVAGGLDVFTPQGWDEGAGDIAVEYARSRQSSPVIFPSQSRNVRHSSRQGFSDGRNAPPIRDNAHVDLGRNFSSTSGNSIRFSYRTYLIRFIPEQRFQGSFKCFDHFCDDNSNADPALILQLVSQTTAIDARYLSFGDFRYSFGNFAASQCRSITELHGVYYHLCYVSFNELLPRRFLNIYAHPPQGTNFCLGTVHIDRVGNISPDAFPDDHAVARYIVQPFSQVNTEQYYHRFRSDGDSSRLSHFQCSITFYRPYHDPVSFILQPDADIAAVKSALCEFLQPDDSASPIFSTDQTHFLDQFSLSDTTLVCRLARDSVGPIHVFGYYPLAHPTFDSCTRLCFGYYTIERLPGSLSRPSEAPISSVNLDDSANVVNGRHRNNTPTGVTFRREQYSSRFSTQPRGRVRFSPMFRLYSNAFMIFTRQDSFSAVHSEDLSRWYVADSGCQETMSSVLHHFIDTTPCKVVIQTAKSGSVITASLRGKLRLPVSNDEGSELDFDIPSGIYTPECDKPLLSIGALIDSGHHVTFTASFSGIKTATSSIPFVWLRGLWWLPVRDSPPPCDTNAFGAVKSTTSTALQLWHLRMGHVGIFALRNLHHVLTGINPLPSQFDFPCHDCMQSKMRHRNKPESSTSTLTRPFELVHFDTLFVEQPTISGCKMDSHFIDGYSHWEVNYVHKYKTNIPVFFDQFKATVNTFRKAGSDARYTIERIRTDNAGELTSASMKQWFADNQVVQELSCPYDQSQNGIPERHGGVKCQMIRGMLSTSRLPSYTWGYASYYAVYIKNRVPSSALSNKHQTPVSPYMLVYGQKPSFSNLHPFGCLCWVYVSKQQSTGWKLSARGLPCVFLGLGNWQGRKAFLALDLSTRRVHATVNAKFDETYFPCRPAGYRRIHNLDLDLSSTSTETPPSSVSDAMDSPQMFTYEHIDEPVLSPETLPPIPSLVQELSDDDEDTVENNYVLLDMPQPCSAVPDPEVQAPPIDIAAAIPPAQPQPAELPPVQQQPFMQFFDEDVQEHAAWSFGSAVSDHNMNAFTVSYALAEPTDIDEPRTHAEAVKSRHADKWLEAERSEHNALIQKEVYDIVSRPRDKQILKARPVYKIKRDSHGTILKFKVRVVVKGYLQKYGVSYFDVFAPVSTVDGIRIIIAIATQRDWGIRQFDVSTAYLNAPIEEEIYVEPPPGFEEPDKKVWLLKKSLYGAKQSAKNWGDFLATVLREYGFRLASSDHYIWTTISLYLALHVDDLAIAYANQDALHHFTTFIKSKFEFNDLGELSYFLGVQIIRNRDLGITQLSQAGYIDQALLKFGLQDANIVNVPLNPGVKFSLADEPKCTDAEHDLYRSLIGSANWKAVWTSPEISFAVHYLSRFLTNPAKAYLKAAFHHPFEST